MNTTVRSVDVARIERLEQASARYVAELDMALSSARRLEAAGLQAGADLRVHLEEAIAHSNGNGTPVSVYAAAAALRQHLEAAVTHGNGTPVSVHLSAVRALRSVRLQGVLS